MANARPTKLSAQFSPSLSCLLLSQTIELYPSSRIVVTYLLAYRLLACRAGRIGAFWFELAFKNMMLASVDFLLE